MSAIALPGDEMAFYIGYNHETCESARKDTVIPAECLEDAIAYALHDLNKGLIQSFQVYNEEGLQVFHHENEAVA